MNIRQEDPRKAPIAALLAEHLEDMARHSPPESIHALDLDALTRPNITFYAAWDGDDLLGCGALAELDATHGEIKSMRTSMQHRRRGIAAHMLEHLIAIATARGYARLSLETGSMAAFAPARALYARYDFEYCGPFGDYALDPNSVFMTRSLTHRDEGRITGIRSTRRHIPDR